jgi:GT2 family glycosyltransferase
MDDIKVGVGIPNTGSINMETCVSIIEMIDGRLPLEFFFSRGSMLPYMRFKITLDALKAKCTHLLFVDSDMKFPRDTLQKLLSHKKDIVSVLYNTKENPPNSVVKFMDGDKRIVGGTFQRDDFPELFECYAVGFGCTLIDLKILEHIELPWYSFEWEVDKKNTQMTGEDVYFCVKARKAGFTTWCDPTIQTGHIGDYTY